jgi:hypothetical protein
MKFGFEVCFRVMLLKGRDKTHQPSPAGTLLDSASSPAVETAGYFHPSYRTEFFENRGIVARLNTSSPAFGAKCRENERRTNNFCMA